MKKTLSIFDILGPIMIGPSSSHTAGVIKIGLIAHNLLGNIPKIAKISLYNSFAQTYIGHGTDKAIVGGLLGFNTYDNRVRDSLDIAKKLGINIYFNKVFNAPKLHPNTIYIETYDKNNNSISLMGASLGGGIIEIQEIQGFSTKFCPQNPTLVIIAKDIPGSLAKISKAIASRNLNIGNMSVNRKINLANIIIELDNDIPQDLIDELNTFKWLKFIKKIEPVN